MNIGTPTEPTITREIKARRAISSDRFDIISKMEQYPITLLIYFYLKKQK
jgi:hypothetical protein